MDLHSGKFHTREVASEPVNSDTIDIFLHRI